MEKSISSLLGILRRHSLPALATFAAVMGGAQIYLKLTPNVYETSARLMLDEKRVSVSELGRDLTQVGAGTPGGANPLANQAELIKSQKVLERSLTKLATAKSLNQLTTAEISSGLRVKIVPATNILEVSYQGKQANTVAQILNAVSQAMVEESADVIRREAASVRLFLEAEVPKLRSRLKLAEAVENNYRQQSGIVSFADQTKSLVDSLAVLENQERDLSTQLQETESKRASLQAITKSENVNTAYATVRGGQDEEIKKLRAKLAELDTELAQTRLRFTDNHPTVISLTESRDALRNLYTQELARVSPENQTIPKNQVASDPTSQQLTNSLINNQVERDAIAKKLKAVRLERAKLQTRLTELPIKQQPLGILTRQREEAAESLKLLQSKLEEARVAEAQLVSNIRIIEKATTPTSPSAPKPLVVQIIAAVFGIILAICIVILLQILDNTLRDASEAEKLLNLPLLGILPKLSATARNLQAPELFLDDMGLVEPYRMLFKNLEFRSEKLRLIVISSTLAGEGKSVVVAHLAAVSAMLQRKTLIIDADLRQPMQHQLFNLPVASGVTHVIEGEKSLQQAVQSTAIDNLSVLTCGELPQRPSALLESANLRNLLTEAASQYDLVIIDTPPLSSCADAFTLGRYSDGLMLTVRPDFTPKENLLAAASEAVRNGLPILGLIINGMTAKTPNYNRNADTAKTLISHSVQRLSPFHRSSS